MLLFRGTDVNVGPGREHAAKHRVGCRHEALTREPPSTAVRLPHELGSTRATGSCRKSRKNRYFPRNNHLSQRCLHKPATEHDPLCSREATLPW